MMMKQQTLAMAADQSGYEHCRKPTRRDEFLKTMEAIVPWTALYDSASLRRFVGIDLGREPVPDATTMLKFRRLLNHNKPAASHEAKAMLEFTAEPPESQSRLSCQIHLTPELDGLTVRLPSRQY